MRHQKRRLSAKKIPNRPTRTIFVGFLVEAIAVDAPLATGMVSEAINEVQPITSATAVVKMVRDINIDF